MNLDLDRQGRRGVTIHQNRALQIHHEIRKARSVYDCAQKHDDKLCAVWRSAMRCWSIVVLMKAVLVKLNLKAALVQAVLVQATLVQAAAAVAMEAAAAAAVEVAAAVELAAIVETAQ